MRFLFTREKATAITQQLKPILEQSGLDSGGGLSEAEKEKLEGLQYATDVEDIKGKVDEAFEIPVIS